MNSQRTEPPHLHCRWDTEVCVLAAASRPELIQRIAELQECLRDEPAVADLAHSLNCPYPAGTARLAIVATSADDLAAKLNLAGSRLAAPACRRIWQTSGVYFTEDPLGPAGRLAFVFPGEGSQYVNMLADLAVHFPEVRDAFDLVDRAFAGHPRGYLPSQLIFPAGGGAAAEGSGNRLWEMDAAAESVFTASVALLALLERLGLRADAMMGHSTGEYSALLASRTIRVDDGVQLGRHIRELNAVYERLSGSGDIPRATLLTVGGVEREVVAAIVDGSAGELQVAIDNCPHQLVLCGSGGAIDRAREALASTPAVCQVLPFDRAYHTPHFATFCDPVREFFGGLTIVPPEVELFSCATASPFPSEPNAIRELAVSQWARPVRFRETVEAMHEAGVRVFVEVGPRSNLTGFVTDTLRGRPVLAVASNVLHRSGIEQINHMVAMLAAHAVPMRLDRLYALRMRPGAAGGNNGREPVRVGGHAARVLPLNLPLLRLNGTLVPPPARGASLSSTNGGPSHSPGSERERRESAVADAVMESYFQGMQRFLETQEEVLSAFLDRRGGARVGAGPLAFPPAPASVPTPESPPTPDTGRELVATALLTALPTPALEIESAPAKAADPVAQQDPERIRETLLAVVAERTGYPTEMLGLTLNLEADLGVDSIKRVEIVGALQRQVGALPVDRIERLAELKSLQQILDLFAEAAERPAGPTVETAPGPTRISPPVAAPPVFESEPAPSLPFVREVLSLIPGVEVTALCILDCDEDLFLRDHTLGGAVSLLDPDLTGLPILPLAVGLEMLAESAAVLMPGQRVAGLRAVRAHRWIALEGESLPLQLHARRRAGIEPVEIQVRLSDPDAADGSPGAILLEGVVLLGARSDPAPHPPELLRMERPSRWTPELLYTEGMFNGPAFQGVESVVTVGEDGMTATLRNPAAPLFRTRSKSDLVLDPVLLDAAGQVVGFWAAEQLTDRFVIFPLGFAELRLHGSPRGDEPVRCRAVVRHCDERTIRSDIFLDAGDRPIARIEGWEDQRFHTSRALSRFVLSSGETELSSPWEDVDGLFPGGVTVRVLDGAAGGLASAEGALWPRVLAHIALGRDEREAWRKLLGPPQRRYEWLLGRLALKEAVRERARAGRPRLADLEIDSNGHGPPRVARGWTEANGAPPPLSLSHAGGVALAAAADPDRYRAVGVDLEPLGRDHEDFASVAFSPEEWALVQRLPEPLHADWALRLWCAKEATAKALGSGLAGNPRKLAVRALDPATGAVTLAVAGRLVVDFPDLVGAPLHARTACTGEWVVASMSIERS